MNAKRERIGKDSELISPSRSFFFPELLSDKQLLDGRSCCIHITRKQLYPGFRFAIFARPDTVLCYARPILSTTSVELAREG